ncbi:ATP synthase subunit delta [Caulifigura coniformis]|uniref:ATP synthase subunit delta n=1 Tax=Caulifigura coniformis TaxID=2527983 RepID=A0A517SBS7_9PLAN|nr:ATP synthase F1 subunit delta [Caulifigura coniformis]QDT53578.1 ATP synthase subunit delta [Caulifigura coniformis]
MNATELPTRPAHVLEDPSSKAVARVYAVAYLDAAAGAGEQNPVEELDSFRVDVLSRNPAFEELLSSRAVGADEKAALLDRTVVPRASQFFGNFLKVLARHERLDLIPYIAEEVRAEHERRTNQKRVEVRSALPLTEAQLTEITDRLRSQMNFEPIVRSSVDPTLLGGVIIRIGDTVYDSSLRTRIGVLRNRLRERYLNEIQSGRNRFSSAEGN